MAVEDPSFPDDLFEQLAACCDDSMQIVAYEEAEAVLAAYEEWKQVIFWQGNWDSENFRES